MKLHRFFFFFFLEKCQKEAEDHYRSEVFNLLLFHEADVQQSCPTLYEMMMCELWEHSVTSATHSAHPLALGQLYLWLQANDSHNGGT